MTEKNADVEWLRERWDQWDVIEPSRAQRLLAHIDELEAENARLIEVAEDKIDINVRPTVHEIAAQIMAGMFANGFRPGDNDEAAHHAYNASEALEAEGRRRDGLL